MEDIVSSLNLDKKEEINLYTKFYMTTLMLHQTDVQRLENTNKILKEFGITIKKASQVKLAFLDSKILFDRLTFAKENNMLLNIVKDPLILMDKSLFINKTKEIKESVEKSKEESVDNSHDIIQNLQAKGLDEVTYEIYDNATTYLTQLAQILNDEISLDLEKTNDNIIKLVTNDYTDIEKILFLSILNENNYNDFEINKIKNSIKEIANSQFQEKMRTA